ncbi:hypothetical protein BCV71DRAFT_107039 [Rhizopus microsporus]|uniref:Uncharacterized protein n=1 Tax=Rhizopus microsporus TaxID=58291 RepID=A0A1X0S429_RHIZD|nr:hypothetical protein BCV71DRAFT_107039 [Rhizopus microsporus]
MSFTWLYLRCMPCRSLAVILPCFLHAMAVISFPLLIPSFSMRNPEWFKSTYCFSLSLSLSLSFYLSVFLFI